MSEQDKIYTELEMMTCSRSDNVYDVPAPVIRDLGATLGSSNSKPICPGKSSRLIKLLVVATIVNFLLMIIIGATVLYLVLVQAGRPSKASRDLSIVQGSGSGAAIGITETPGPPGNYFVDN